jgi:hypothetical protein
MEASASPDGRLSVTVTVPFTEPANAELLTVTE